jgi:hypothetical protein
VSNNRGNTKTRADIKKSFDSYIKNQVTTSMNGAPTSVSDQVAREMFSEFLQKRCRPPPEKHRHEESHPTVGVNTGIFQGTVGSDFQPKSRDPLITKLFADKGYNAHQAIADQMRFKMKEKSKMAKKVLTLAAATGKPACTVIAAEEDGGWGRHAGVLNACKGVDGDINWTYVDIYQLMDYLTTYHSEVAFKYFKEVKHSK